MIIMGTLAAMEAFSWFIHNRFKSFKTNNPYLLGIRRAHKIHHKSIQKQPSEQYGLLLASKRFFKKDM